MGARLIAVGLLGIALALPAVCSAAGWSSPKRVATASADALVLPYYVQSPNGRRTDLVVGSYGRPDSVYPMRSNGRFAHPWRIPRKLEPSDADIAMNDAGATVLAWAVDRPNPQPDDRLDPCWCEIHALVRRTSGRFTAARKLTDAADLSYVVTAIAPGGRATVFTSYWHPEVTQTPVSVAEAASGRPFGRARTILPDVPSFSLDSRAGKPVLLFQAREGEQSELAPPYTTPASVGTLPGEGWFGGDPLSGRAFAGDGYGHELLFDSEIAVSARTPGGTFGELHKFATPAPGDECGISARMNRRIAVVGWNCGDEQTGTAQVAVLTRGGRLLSLSKKRRVYVSGEAPNVALDADGHWVVAWRADVENQFVALTGRGRRADGFRTVVPHSDQTDALEVAVTRDGVAHATWEDDRRHSVAVLDSRLRIGRPAR